MNTAGKVFTTFLITTAILVPVAAVTAAATVHYTDTKNPVNFCLYCRFKIIENSVKKDSNFYAVKKFIDSGNSKYCLTVTSTDVLVTQFDTFNFYDSWKNVPAEIKKDTSLATNWDAVERYVTAKEKEIKERKAKEKEKELKKKQLKKS